MRLLQVLPAEASPGGVGAFAAVLGAALRRGRDDVEELRVSPASGDRDAFAAMLEPGAASARGTTSVLLHYVGYGYDRRGCPDWLVAGLEAWRRSGAERRLVTVFHEVYASGPPWRSSFWLMPRQRRLAARLARLSDAATTSIQLYRGLVARWRRDVSVLPVASTFGEPERVPPLATRAPRLVVLGAAGNRRRVYESRAVCGALRALRIEEVADVGPPLPHRPERVAGAVVRGLGTLPAEDVGRLLLESRAGCLGHASPFLGKSTVFAAYCSHGMAPVCLSSAPPAPGEPAAGREYWSPGAAADEAALEGIARAARSWYAGHDLAAQARHYLGLLEPPVEPRRP